MLNYTNRSMDFDAAHTVLYNSDGTGKGKCANRHGHRYNLQAQFGYETPTLTDSNIGYPIDFAEIKRVYFSFIDEYFDHGFVANPKDISIITLCHKEKSKIWIMSLGNPSAENMAKELFYIGQELLNDVGLKMAKIKLNETANCQVECEGLNLEELQVFRSNVNLNDKIKQWKKKVGTKIYDIRLLPPDLTQPTE